MNCWQFDFTAQTSAVGSALLPVLAGTYETGQYRYQEGQYWSAKLSVVLFHRRASP